MPAYIQHHRLQHQADTAPAICPNCVGLMPMYLRDVDPRWSTAEIDFVYECCDCGAEVRQTLRKAEARH